MSRLARQSQKTEEGAVAVIVAASMLALLLAAGLVLDFGQARTDKVTNKGFADSAAAAGIRANDGGDGSARPYRGVCAALAYLRTNPELATLTPTWSGECAAGSALLNVPCVPNTTQASYSGTADGGRISVQVKSGYKTPDPAFDKSGSPDNGSGDGCDQLAVFVTETDQPGLGSLATNDDIVTRVRTVARMTAASTSEGAVALLMLERTECPAISLGSINTRIEVKGFGTTPGSIHSDSSGTTGCSANTKVLTGKFANGIVARQSETGTPRIGGVITTVARSGAVGAVAANDTDGAANVCAEVGTGCVAATGRALVGRGLVDRRYVYGARLAMGAAATEYNKTRATAVSNTIGNNYTILETGCNNFSTSSNATKIYVNCPSGVNFNNTTFANATDVVFNGPVTLKSTNTLSMPNAVRVYIKGISGGDGLNSVGTLNLNTGGAATCAGQTTRGAKLVIGNGSFSAGAQTNIQLCQTSVLLAGSNGGSALVGTPPSDGSTSLSCPLPTPPVAGTGIPPYLNSCGGYLNLGAGGTMDWSAPNLVIGAKPSQAQWDNLEDLALWTESSHESKIGGGGTMTVSGVFFAPNSNPFTISGGGTQSNAANAQFVARKLAANGQGTLYMRPDPFNSITIPLPPTFGLVR